MVDFAELMAISRARRTPEAEAQFERATAREARYDATRHDIVAVFERLARHPNSGLPVAVATRERMITIRLEDDECGPKLRFIGGPTGAEVYHLSDDLIERLAAAVRETPEARWTICFGAAGGHEACHVAVADVVSYLVNHERMDALDRASPGF